MSTGTGDERRSKTAARWHSDLKYKLRKSDLSNNKKMANAVTIQCKLNSVYSKMSEAPIGKGSRYLGSEKTIKNEKLARTDRVYRVTCKNVMKGYSIPEFLVRNIAFV